jgi:hypothetical protein
MFLYLALIPRADGSCVRHGAIVIHKGEYERLNCKKINNKGREEGGEKGRNTYKKRFKKSTEKKGIKKYLVFPAAA